MDELERNFAYARDFYENHPEKFKDLVTQIKGMAPVIEEVMSSGLFLQLMALTDSKPEREDLERLCIGLDNICAQIRRIMEKGKGSLTMAVILEHLKAASRHIQDASDDLLRLSGGNA